MKQILHILLLATILLLPLSLSAQNKGFRLPSKKQSTTSTNNSDKNNSSKKNNNFTKKENSNTTQPKELQRKEQERQTREQRQREEQERKQREAEELKRENQRIIQNLVDNMVYVEGGTFIMGATVEQGSDVSSYEKPAHNVTLSSFSIGKYEVTQAEWQAVMGSNPSHYKGSNLPIENVSWNECQVFIRKLNRMTGKHFRLPTEAEWEYAARGGNHSQVYMYAGSNTLGTVVWHNENSRSTTHPVGIKSPNELGLYDMTGNVWEWCQDRFGAYSNSAIYLPEKGVSQHDPTGPISGSNRVCRGGSYGSSAGYCRVSNRLSHTPSSAFSSLGLRLAL